MNSWTCERASRIRDVWTGGCVSTSTRKRARRLSGLSKGLPVSVTDSAEPAGRRRAGPC